MASLDPLTVAELGSAVAQWESETAVRSAAGRRIEKPAARALHDLLVRTTVLSPPSSAVLTADVVRLAATVPAAIIKSLKPRPRVALALISSGMVDAAWAVLCDNAAGVVVDPFLGSTATGAPRVGARRPMRVLVEAPHVFARLPGFRDPRFGAPDECYEIADAIKLEHQLDEVETTDDVLTLGGWAALDIVICAPDESVRLVLQRDGEEVVRPGQRLRRPDLVTGRDEGLVRRAWAGWSASVDLAEVGPGEWSVRLELSHRGVVRRVAIGGHASELAKVQARGARTVNRRLVQWDTTSVPWRLIVVKRRPTQWGGVLRRTSR